MGDKDAKPLWWHVAGCFVFIVLGCAIMWLLSELVICLVELYRAKWS